MARYANAKLVFTDKSYAPVAARKRFLIKLSILLVLAGAAILYLSRTGMLRLAYAVAHDIVIFLYSKLRQGIGKYWLADNIKLIITWQSGIYYIPTILETVILVVMIWKLFFRKEIRGILRITNIILLALSGVVNYGFFHILKRYAVYRLVEDFLSVYPTFGYVFLFAMNNEAYIFTLFFSLMLFISYVCYKRLYKRDIETSLDDSQAVSTEGSLDGYEMKKQLGYYDILENAKKISGRFQKAPELYFTDTMPNNGYNISNVIVYDINVASNPGSGPRWWYNSRGTIAHEFGHCYNKDTTAMLVCDVAINTLFLPIEIVILILSLINRFIWWTSVSMFLIRISIMVGNLICQIVKSLTSFIAVRVLGLFGGKRQEIKADRFAVDVGFGAAIYANMAELTDEKGITAAIRRFFDVHPSSRKRCRLIRKRMIKVYGMRYWKDFMAEYMATCYYSTDEADPADIYLPRLDAKSKKDALAAAKEIASRYYGAEDKKSQQDISRNLREKIIGAYGSIDRLYEACDNGEKAAKWHLCLLKTSFLLSRH